METRKKTSKEELREKLYDLLMKENISIDTTIFNDFIFGMAGLTVEGSDYSPPGLNLRESRYESYDKKENGFTFRVPSLLYPELVKLLDAVKFPIEKYKTNESIVLEAQIVLEHIFGAFKAWFENAKAAEPDKLVKYVVESKAFLESSGLNTIRKYGEDAIKVVDKEAKPAEVLETVVGKVSLLMHNVNKVENDPSLYEKIIEAKKGIDASMQDVVVAQHVELTKQLKQIDEGLQLFTKYHRCKSKLANAAFVKEIKEFLKEQKGTPGKPISSIVPEALCVLAGVELDSEVLALKAEPGEDSSRLVFRFADLKKENATKIVNYLWAIDETAKKGSGSQHEGSVAPHRMMAMAASLPSERTWPPYKEGREYCSIEMDGEIFYNKLFSQMKEVITNGLKLSKPLAVQSSAESEQKEALPISMFKRPILQVAPEPTPSNELQKVAIYFV